MKYNQPVSFISDNLPIQSEKQKNSSSRHEKINIPNGAIFRLIRQHLPRQARSPLNLGIKRWQCSQLTEDTHTHLLLFFFFGEAICVSIELRRNLASGERFQKGWRGEGRAANCSATITIFQLSLYDETQLFLWKSGKRKERERISNKTEERRKKGERGWLKSFNPSTSGGGNGSKHEARKTIKIGASWMASRHQPGVRWTRGWPSLPPLLFFPRAERHEEGRGWGEPSLGIKRVLRSARVWVVVTASLYTGTSTRAVAHLSSEPLFPFLLFSFIFLFSFPFLFFFSSLLLFMPTFVVHRPAHDSTRRRRRCLSMEVGVKMETRFVSFPRIVVKVEDVWVLNV